MNRRSFLSTVAALPLMGRGAAKAGSKYTWNEPVLDYKSPFNMTATEVRRREVEMMERMVNPPVLVSDDEDGAAIADWYDGRWRYFSEDRDELG